VLSKPIVHPVEKRQAKNSTASVLGWHPGGFRCS
jgi:hypothetical protein